MAGFANKRDIYDEMLRRAAALDKMADRDLTHYDDVFDAAVFTTIMDSSLHSSD